MSEIEIVGAEQLEQLASLQPIAEEIFGRKQRAPNWMQRKLTREQVLPELSAIARERESGSVCGYALLGRPASLQGRARGAGLGVLAAVRRRGVGRELIEFACARAQAAGCGSVEFLVEPDRLDWYAARGFAVVEAQRTLVSQGLGSAATELECGATLATAPIGEHVLWSWTPEAWALTPPHERAYLQLQSAQSWLTREGRAWLVQRFELLDPEQLEPSLLQLRERIPAGMPLLAYPCPAAGPTAAGLQRSGFEVLQRSFILRRDI